ncbi:NAD(P)-dependent oxidoreductase [Frankia sp. Cr1]|uniref:NAD(P)-dependent oxidoreductase n=1 Tax=Frankia sp. Cr1 TaxID=3073931 RepID=UPI002AD1FC15|nr:NAD(P)-dependent oxidoreductase [Frankia sp. Cr1]
MARDAGMTSPAVGLPVPRRVVEPRTSPPRVPAASAGERGPVIASVAVRGESGDGAALVRQVVATLGDAAEIVDRGMADGGQEARLALADGVVLRVVAGPPTNPKAEPEHTIVISAIVDHVGAASADKLRALLSAVARVGFTPLELAELRAQMPLTATLPRFVAPRCLGGVAPMLTVHHMTDFLVMVEAALAMGVSPSTLTVIDKGYRYRHTGRVDAHLRALGIAVFPWTAARAALVDHAGRARALGRRGVLIDDGGYTLPTLLDQLPDLVPAFAGLVEQTTSGIIKLEPYADRLPVPVFSVAESRLKATIESFGIADASIRNTLRLLPEEKFEGQPALVIGFGRIGEQIAEVLRDRRMRVAVYDTTLVRLIAAHERGFLTARSLAQLLAEHQPLLVVGTTGRPSVRGEHLAFVRRDCYLVSTTSRTNEFALDELTDEAQHVRDVGVTGVRLHLGSGPAVTVLADGFPINFHHAESLPNKFADLVLAALLVGAATLARPDHGFAPGHNVAATDAVLESCGLLDRYYQRFGPTAR